MLCASIANTSFTAQAEKKQTKLEKFLTQFIAGVIVKNTYNFATGHLMGNKQLHWTDYYVISDINAGLLTYNDDFFGFTPKQQRITGIIGTVLHTAWLLHKIKKLDARKALLEQSLEGTVNKKLRLLNHNDTCEWCLRTLAELKQQKTTIMQTQCCEHPICQEDLSWYVEEEGNKATLDLYSQNPTMPCFTCNNRHLVVQKVSDQCDAETQTE